MGKTLSVVVMFHDMGGRNYIRRLFRLKVSMMEQYALPDEIIVVDSTQVPTPDMDYGEGEWREESSDVGTGMIHSHFPLDVFNKSKSLNHGLSFVKSEYVMFIDIDFIFHPNAISSIKNVMSENRMILGIADYLAVTPEHPFDWNGLVTVASGLPRVEMHSPGAIQVAPTTWFRKVGGHGEEYDDVKNGTATDGLELYWIEEPLFFHCPHPRE